MPLVKIDLVKNVRSPTELKHLADIIQSVMLEKFNAPDKDRYQIITQHEPYELICEDTNLGFKRTDKLVIIQIFQQGRGRVLKEGLYGEMGRRLEKECGVLGDDLIITCVENTKEDWSFGHGRGQFLTGEL